MSEEHRPWERAKPLRPPSRGGSEIGGSPQNAPKIPSVFGGATKQPASAPVRPGYQSPAQPPSAPLNNNAKGSGGSDKRRTKVLAAAAVLVISGFVVFASTGTDGGDSDVDVVSESLKPKPSASETSVAVPSVANEGENALSANGLRLGDLIQSIVYIQTECGNDLWRGSGTVIINGSHVLTNHHVAPGGECVYLICFTETWDQKPVCEAFGELVAEDVDNDLAILRLIDEYGNTLESGRPPISISDEDVAISDEITLVGYPGIGGDTITSVSGVVSGAVNFPDDGRGPFGDFFKTDAVTSSGVSGGAAFNSMGQYIGTPTAGSFSAEEATSLGLVRPARFARALVYQVSRG